MSYGWTPNPWDPADPIRRDALAAAHGMRPAGPEIPARPEIEANVVELLGDDEFRVVLSNGAEVIARTSATLHALGRVRIERADRVLVELSPYDVTRGHIVYRYK